jgi:hypothetical protein
VWRSLFFPHLLGSSRSDGILRNNIGVLAFHNQLLSRWGYWSLVVGNRPLDMLCLDWWSQHTFSIFHFYFWLTLRLIAKLGILLDGWRPRRAGARPPPWLLVFFLLTSCEAFALLADSLPLRRGYAR